VIPIRAFVAFFAPSSKLNLRWDEVKLPEILIPVAKATLIEDNFKGEIGRKGHGFRRSLMLTFDFMFLILEKIR